MSEPDDVVEDRQRRFTGLEVKRLAATGIAAVGLRSVAIRLIAFGGTIVVARLIIPRDLGIIAIGTTLVMVFTFVGDAGIGAGLIRGARAPERKDLQAFLGLQLLVTLVLAGVTAAIGLSHGLVGQVTTLMVAALPLTAFRTPGVIMFERNLRYQPLVVVELLETVVYYLWAIATLVAGWGVWGLASASPVRAAAGAILMSAISPAGFLLPIASWSRVRGLLRFGLQYQAVSAVALIRDQGINIGTAVISGLSVLGFWNLAYRILQVPYLVFDAAWRVSFPAMARFIGTGEDPKPVMERGLAMAAFVTGGVLAAMVGSAPGLVPGVFGHQWAPVTPVLPWAALGLMFGGPVSVATGGYLYAVGDAMTVLSATILHTLAWFVVGFPLLHIVGLQAIGIGWFAANLVEAIVLGLRTRRHTPIDFVQPLLLPFAIGACAALAGWLAATALGSTFGAGIVGGLLAAVVYVGPMIVLRRRLARDLLDVGGRAVVQLVR